MFFLGARLLCMCNCYLCCSEKRIDPGFAVILTDRQMLLKQSDSWKAAWQLIPIVSCSVSVNERRHAHNNTVHSTFIQVLSSYWLFNALKKKIRKYGSAFQQADVQTIFSRYKWKFAYAQHKGCRGEKLMILSGKAGVVVTSSRSQALKKKTTLKT